MTFVMLPPFQDELAIGFTGRVGAFNALGSIEQTIKSLRAKNNEISKETKLAALARSCSMDYNKFVNAHSMFPLHRAVTKYVGHKDELVVEQSTIRLWGLRSLRVSAMFCMRCATSDVREQGVSYWHRHHHLPGIDWCLQHNSPLMYAPTHSYSTQPETVSKDLTQVNECTVDKEMMNPVLQRLAQVQRRWLETPSPIHAAAISMVFKNRCKELDLRLGQGGKRPVVSDLARSNLPDRWMEKHFPSLLTKRPEEFLHKLDGSVTDRHVAYPSFVYAMVIAVLFESIDLAFDLLEKANFPFRHPAASLSSSAVTSEEKAVLSFLDGANLIEACRLYGVKQNNVESILRAYAQSGKRTTILLSDISTVV